MVCGSRNIDIRLVGELFRLELIIVFRHVASPKRWSFMVLATSFFCRTDEDCRVVSIYGCPEPRQPSCNLGGKAQLGCKREKHFAWDQLTE